MSLRGRSGRGRERELREEGTRVVAGVGVDEMRLASAMWFKESEGRERNGKSIG